MDLIKRLDDLLARAREAERAGTPGKALDILDEAPPPVRSFGTWHYARGALLFRLGEVEAATEPLRQAAVRLPEVAEAHADLAEALAERVRRRRAATGSKPTSADAFAAETRQLEEALAAAHAACKLKPGHPRALRTLGAVLEALGQPEDARAAFEAAEATAPPGAS